MNRVTKTLVLVLLVTIAAGAFAADASSPRAGKTWSITFYNSTKVGTTMLPAGTYKAQQLVDGDNHVLVFKDAGNKEPSSTTPAAPGWTCCWRLAVPDPAAKPSAST